MDEATQQTVARLIEQAREYGGVEGICNRLDRIVDGLEELRDGQCKLESKLSEIGDSLQAIEINTE